jgi:hypothetical protein
MGKVREEEGEQLSEQTHKASGGKRGFCLKKVWVWATCGMRGGREGERLRKNLRTLDLFSFGSITR